MSICFLSLETSKVFNQLILKHLEEVGYEGISMSSLLIFPYLQKSDKQSISTLAKELNQSRQATHKSIKKLEELDYIKLVQEKNKKEINISLTKKGNALLEEANSFIEKLQSQLTKIVGKKELEQFIENQNIIFDYLNSKLD
ncbi:MarR family winged helix-turn-helix transcriptional regulator [Halarcobacter sp.]|uniref:MarR family winged helix-turn-helix transcriptional regulator n=1 Tax=Halarcobacter sp. TaxID=2321133 RepID=UPI003A8E0B20